MIEDLISRRHFEASSKGGKLGALTTNSMKVECPICQFKSTPAGVASHQRSTGHGVKKRKYTLSAAGRKGGRLGAAIINSRKYICLDCGKISTPGGIANHSKYSGHIAYEEYIT